MQLPLKVAPSMSFSIWLHHKELSYFCEYFQCFRVRLYLRSSITPVFLIYIWDSLYYGFKTIHWEKQMNGHNEYANYPWNLGDNSCMSQNVQTFSQYSDWYSRYCTLHYQYMGLPFGDWFINWLSWPCNGDNNPCINIIRTMPYIMSHIWWLFFILCRHWSYHPIVEL